MSDNRSMSLRFLIALVLSLVCLALPAWADFQAGMDANNRGDYAIALREWQSLAEQRDALAKQMTSAQIAEAQKLVQEWKPKKK